MRDEVIISVKDLHKSYGKHEVLKGVDVDIRKEEVVCIIGPSGGGKYLYPLPELSGAAQRRPHFL